MKSCLLSLLVLLAQHTGSAQAPAPHRLKINLSGLATRDFQFVYEFRKDPQKSLEISLGAQLPDIDHSEVFYGQWVTYYAFRQTTTFTVSNKNPVGEPTVEYEGTGRRLPDLPAYITKSRFPVQASQRYYWRLPKRRSLEIFVQPGLGFSWNTEYQLEDFITIMSKWKEVSPASVDNPAHYRESTVTYYRQSRLMNLESYAAPLIDLAGGLLFSPWRGLVIEGRVGVRGEWQFSAPAPRYKFLYMNRIEPRIMLLAGWAF